MFRTEVTHLTLAGVPFELVGTGEVTVYEGDSGRLSWDALVTVAGQYQAESREPVEVVFTHEHQRHVLSGQAIVSGLTKQWPADKEPITSLYIGGTGELFGLWDERP